MMGQTGNALRWKSSGRAMLFTAALLSSCFLLTQAEEISIRVEPSQPLQGQDITLTPGGRPSFVQCNWYQGDRMEQNMILLYAPTLSPPLQLNGPRFTGRETLDPDCSLHVSNLMQNDSGIYSVIKTVSGGPETGSVHIEILVQLTKPTVSAFPCPYVVEFNDSVTLTCETHNGPVKMRWFKNGSPLGKMDRTSLSGDNRTLSIPNIIRADAGRYQCEASNAESAKISDVKYIDVIYGPEIPVIHPTDKLYEEHSEVKLTCEADTFPDAHYIWFLNGTQCGTGSKLFIPDVTPEHSGTYLCQAMNVLTLQKRNSTLAIEVEGAPEVEVHDVTVTGPSIATEDQPITLMCTAVGSSITYSWFKGGQRLEPGYHVILTNNNQNLTLSPSHRSDSGTYTCRAVNSLSSSFSEPHRLDILYGPDPPVIHEVFNKDRFKLSFLCRADSYPAASYLWFLNGKVLPEQQNPFVRNLAAEFGGNYTCQAENRSTRQKRNTTLELEVQGQWM